MNKIFLITYDLKIPGQDYTKLYEGIKDLGEYIHPLESTWFVRVEDNHVAADINNRLHALMDKNDSLFVVDITDQNRQGWMPKSFWTWLK